MIYLIYNEEYDKLKIGYSNDPVKRFGAIQTSHWADLKLIHMEDGTLEEERFIHQSLAAYNIRGEWYNYKDIKELLPYYLTTWNKYTTTETGALPEIPFVSSSKLPYKRVFKDSSIYIPPITYKDMVELYKINNDLADLEQYKYKEDYYKLITDSLKLYNKVWLSYTHAKNMVDNYTDQSKTIKLTIEKAFFIGEKYSSKRIKNILSQIYKDYEISKKPKATDLLEFAKTKAFNGREGRGFQILHYY